MLGIQAADAEDYSANSKAYGVTLRRSRLVLAGVSTRVKQLSSINKRQSVSRQIVNQDNRGYYQRLLRSSTGWYGTGTEGVVFV